MTAEREQVERTPFPSKATDTEVIETKEHDERSVLRVLMMGVGSNPFITDWAKAAQASSEVIGIRTSGRLPQRSTSLGGGLFLDRTAGIPVVLSPTRKRRPSRVFATGNANRQTRALVRAASWISDNIGRPHILHSHFASGSAGVPGAAKQLGIPYIHTEHSSSFVWGEQGPSRAGKRILRDITANAVITTFVSDGLRVAAERMGAEGRFAVLSNPVDAGIFPPPSPSARTDTTIITVGSLIPRKRIDLILEAFKLVSQKVPELRLIIVGSGPLKDKLHGYARELGVLGNVAFTGYLNREVVARLLSEATLYVHGSEAETFGVSLVEAQLAGLPVVTTQSGGVTLDRHDRFMQVIDEPSAAALADAIQEFLDEGVSLATRVDIAARAREAYSFDAVADRLQALYREALA